MPGVVIKSHTLGKASSLDPAAYPSLTEAQDLSSFIVSELMEWNIFVFLLRTMITYESCSWLHSTVCIHILKKAEDDTMHWFTFLSIRKINAFLEKKETKGNSTWTSRNRIWKPEVFTGIVKGPFRALVSEFLKMLYLTLQIMLAWTLSSIIELFPKPLFVCWIQVIRLSWIWAILRPVPGVPPLFHLTSYF